MHILQVQVYLQKSIFKPALAALKNAARLSDDSTFALARLAPGYAIAGEQEKVCSLLKRLHAMAARKYVAPFETALIHAGLRDYDEALPGCRKPSTNVPFGWVISRWNRNSIPCGKIGVLGTGQALGFA